MKWLTTGKGGKKMNLITKNSEIARVFWDKYTDENSVAIDATCGNGNDTLYLCQRVKRVYGFDIQQVAIDNTAALLKENSITNYELICDDHRNVDRYIQEEIDLAVYNLGYLPRGDKHITTKADSTLESLEKVLELVKVNGLISITIYWGHEEGRKERERVVDFLRNLDSQRYHVLYLQMINQSRNAPELMLVTRKK